MQQWEIILNIVIVRYFNETGILFKQKIIIVEVIKMDNNKIIERIQSKWITAGKKANLILQLMKNEKLPCEFHEAMEIAIKVSHDEIDFEVFFNNYKMAICK